MPRLIFANCYLSNVSCLYIRYNHISSLINHVRAYIYYSNALISPVNWNSWISSTYTSMQAHTCCPAPGGNHNYHWANKGERKNKFHQIRTHVFDKESIKYLSHTSLQFPPSTLSNPVKLMDHHSRPNEKPGFCLRAEGPKSINNSSMLSIQMNYYQYMSLMLQYFNSPAKINKLISSICNCLALILSKKGPYFKT